MDRLPLVVLAGLAACGGGNGSGGAEAPTRSRVNSVAAQVPATVDLSDFCDASASAQDAKPLVWPEIRPPGKAPVAGQARWINLWATWCKPCVAELPRIAAWHKSVGAKVDHALTFVSADTEPSDVDAFVAEHAEVKATLQLADADSLAPWLDALGIKGGALPVHVFVDAENRVRCVKMSEVGEGDKAAVEQLLQSL